MATPEWNIGSRSNLVCVGTSCLYLQVSGPDRIPDVPVVVIIQGLGSCASSWAAVVRLLRPWIRVVIYDRAGLGKSKPSSLRPNLSNIVQELKELLSVTGIAPPYLIVAHSWGGVLAREFIASSPDEDIAGLVLVEANHERTLQVLDWRVFIDWINTSRINAAEALDIKNRHQMLPIEWREYQEDAARPGHIEQSKKELAEYALSFPLLALNDIPQRNPPLLGLKPLGILVGTNGTDLTMLYDAAVAKGFGTPDEVAYFRQYVRDFGDNDFRLQSEAKNLSTNCIIIRASENSGHQVQVTEPAAIAEMVKSTMRNAEIGCRLGASSGGESHSHI